MKNIDLITNFVKNENFNARNNSMMARDKKLYSYDTCIAQHTEDGRLLINNTKYSVTTSKQQGYLRAAANRYHNKVEYVDNIRINTQRLE